MSYIIAFVRFSSSSQEYPAQCFGTNILPPDDVLVRNSNGVLKSGVVTRVEYLDWDCGITILCKMSEVIAGSDGPKAPINAPVTIGLATLDALAGCLIAKGWTPLKPGGSVHKTVFTFTRGNQTANIWIRRRGVDLQIYQSNGVPQQKEYSIINVGLGEGKYVRHYLSQTTFNLFEGIARFADSFMQSNENLDKFFVPVGSKDRRTSTLRLSTDSKGEKDLYAALGGDVDPVYVGDGLYLSRSGQWIDD